MSKRTLEDLLPACEHLIKMNMSKRKREQSNPVWKTQFSVLMSLLIAAYKRPA